MRRIIQQSRIYFLTLFARAILLCLIVLGVQDVYTQTWELSQTIGPEETSAEYFFGTAIAISGDQMLIGAPGSNAYGGYGESGKIYNYRLQTDNSWELAGLIDIENLFGLRRIGFGSAIKMDGNIAVVRVNANQIWRENNGVFIFEYKSDGSWEQVKTIAWSNEDTSSPDFDELTNPIWDIAISGDRVILGSSSDDTYAANSGCVYIYEKGEEGSWEQVDKLFSKTPQPNAYFGNSIDISGDAIIVSSGSLEGNLYRDKHVHIYEKGLNGNWEEVDKFSSENNPSDGFGRAIAIDGDRAVVGAHSGSLAEGYIGYLTILERNQNGTWNRSPKLMPSSSNDFVAAFVDIEKDVIVGGALAKFDETPILLYEKQESGEWTDRTLLSEERPMHGGISYYIGSVDQGRVLIGSLLNEFRADFTGIAYLFEKTLPSCTVVNTNDDGPGSLRDLVDNHPECDTIYFDPSLAGKTIELTTGQILIDRNVVIWGQTNGSSTTISGDHKSRIFEIAEGDTVEIHRTAIEKGKAESAGGAILNQGVLKIDNCSIIDCEVVTVDGSSLSSGGAIQNRGHLEIRGTFLTGNKAGSGGAIYNSALSSFYGERLQIWNNTATSFGGGAIYNASNTQSEIKQVVFYRNSTPLRGGAIFNQGRFTITECDFEENTAQVGGAIHNSRSSGEIIMLNVDFIKNQATDQGGAIWTQTGGLIIAQSLFEENEVDAFGDTSEGGAIYIDRSEVEIMKSIFSNNVVKGVTTGAKGGAIYNRGLLSMKGSTIANNKALTNGKGAGVFIDEGGEFSISESSIYENYASSLGAGVFNIGKTQMVNTTIAKNEINAQATDGVGVYNEGEMSINFSTIAYNYALASARGTGLYNSGELFLSNSIIAHNTNEIPGTTFSSDAFNESTGTIHDLGYNLLSDLSDIGLTEENSNLLAMDPIFGEWVSVEGKTAYYTLNGWAPSPCIEAANPTDAPSIDQRGANRPAPSGGAPDIGAYEFELPLAINPKDLEEKRYTLYPNPTKDGLWIKREEIKASQTTISIRNELGQILFHAKWDGQSLWIQTDHFPKGIYFLSIMENERGGLETHKFVKY